MIDTSKIKEFFDGAAVEKSVHIIGCGAVGSTLAENLARLDIRNFKLYDFDIIEEHNIANQMFSVKDIGRSKVDVCEEIIKNINPDANIEKFPKGYTFDESLDGYVFVVVDSIELRKKICEENKYNLNIDSIFDIRMRLTDGQCYAAKWNDKDAKNSLIATMQFSDEDAMKDTPMSACHVSLSVAPTVRIITAYQVINFMNYILNGSIKKVMFINAFNFDIDAF